MDGSIIVPKKMMKTRKRKMTLATKFLDCMRSKSKTINHGKASNCCTNKPTPDN
uniref:Candidate secreted effector n=1 Tax=Meloidogyne incognita TaxID=6306 RepID=A0A914MHK5_MELIC